jgi:hypothetical protein
MGLNDSPLFQSISNNPNLLEADVDGNTTEADQSTEGVVGAADRAGSAAASSGTDDGDGVAGQTNEASQGADVDPKQSQEAGDGIGGGLLGRLAALDGTGVAVTSVGAGRNVSGGSDSDSGESSDGDNSELVEHGEEEKLVWRRR